MLDGPMATGLIMGHMGCSRALEGCRGPHPGRASEPICDFGKKLGDHSVRVGVPGGRSVRQQEELLQDKTQDKNFRKNRGS